MMLLPPEVPLAVSFRSLLLLLLLSLLLLVLLVIRTGWVFWTLHLAFASKS
jgi:hypothetical protein